MQVEITNKFRKQVKKLNNKNINNSLVKVIQSIGLAKNISEINNLKKLKGYKHFYRIRLGDYRIGVTIKDKIITLAAIDHRSNIYKYFP